MIFVIVLGMALVTMIPRIIPAFVVEKLVFRGWMNRWLNAVPYAALGALIFPGIMSVQSDNPFIGLVGGLVAVGLSLVGLNVIFVVLGAIATVFLLSM